MTRESAPQGAPADPRDEISDKGTAPSPRRELKNVRAPYKEAGRQMREARARAMRANLTPLELKVLLVVIELTASYSKYVDSSSARQIAAKVYLCDPDDLKGGQRKRVSTALASLSAKGVIFYETSRGHYARPNISLIPFANVPSREDIGVVNDLAGGFQCPPGETSMSLGGDSNVPPARVNTEKEYLEELPSARDRYLSQCERRGVDADDANLRFGSLKADAVSDDAIVGGILDALPYSTIDQLDDHIRATHRDRMRARAKGAAA